MIRGEDNLLKFDLKNKLKSENKSNDSKQALAAVEKLLQEIVEEAVN